MRAFVACGGLALAFAASAAALDTGHFRYERPLSSAGAGPILVEPDGALYAHTRPGFADLRILEASGTQVPWRPLPAAAPVTQVDARVLNAGRQGRYAVALLDLGPKREVRDRLELDVPDSGFVATVQVSGSNDRRRFTRLSTSEIYDVTGATSSARSTTVVFPPSDFRYLFLRARGISRIDGATAFAPQPSGRRIERPGTVRHASADPTRLILDLGHRNVPVDALYVTARTRRYDRNALVEGSNDGKIWSELARTRVYRVTGSVPSPIELQARHRFLRVTIFNGDDEPLRGVRLRATARPRTLVVEGGHAGGLRVLYGNSAEPPPRYDYARLPRNELGLARARPGTLGAEAANSGFEPPPDTRSFAARHPAVVTAALVLAAAVVAAGGFLALRKRA